MTTIFIRCDIFKHLRIHHNNKEITLTMFTHIGCYQCLPRVGASSLCIKIIGRTYYVERKEYLINLPIGFLLNQRGQVAD